jgi:hypothetical protein
VNASEALSTSELVPLDATGLYDGVINGIKEEDRDGTVDLKGTSVLEIQKREKWKFHGEDG